MFTAQNVKELREMTGCGMMDCKKALTETGGDMEKAVEFLREKGLSTAAKKAGRIAAEGLVESFVFDNIGVVVEVNSETDFVAKNKDFQDFVHNVAAHIAKNNPKSIEELSAQKFDADENKTVDDALKEKIAVIGENMNIRRFVRYEGVCEAYVHGGGRIGVLVLFDVSDNSVAQNSDFKAFAKDIAMQIAAAIPQFNKKEDVATETLQKEQEILLAQALNEGKPKEIAEKMVAGRIQKYYKEVCLNEQAYIKNPDISVAQYIKDTIAQLGTEISVLSFTRFERGEGLAKKEDDFAAEVAKMTGK